MLEEIDVVILAGGLGTRLREVVKDIPKPMAEICGKPFLEYILQKLSKEGFKKVIMCVGYKAEVIKNYFKDKYLNLNIIYSEEEKPLGTAGAIKNALKLIKSTRFILMNGDSYVKLDFKKLLKFHKIKNSYFTIVTTKVNNPLRYGSIQVDENLRIIHFAEKSNTDLSLINAGIYLIEKKILEKMNINITSIEKDLIPTLLGRNIYSFESKGPFIDIGTKESYLKIKDNTDFLKKLFS